MTLLRRSLVVMALMFWQGGFTFYASVVVPIGQKVLESHLEQGFITRQVTNYLNLSGAVALLPLAWDMAVSRDHSAGRRRLRWLSWAIMVLTLGVLVWLHGHLDDLLDPKAVRILDGRIFRTGHRWYLWISTIQWAFGIVYTVLALLAWRDEDRLKSQPT